MKTLHYALISIILLSILSCTQGKNESTEPQTDNETEHDETINQPKVEWSSDIAYGVFQAKTTEGITVSVEFAKSKDGLWQVVDEGFYISYKLPDGREMRPVATTTSWNELYLFEKGVDELAFNKTIQLLPPELVTGWKNKNFDKEVSGTYSEVTIQYLNEDEILLTFASAKQILEESFKFNSSENSNSIKLKRLVKSDGAADNKDLISSGNINVKLTEVVNVNDVEGGYTNIVRGIINREVNRQDLEDIETIALAIREEHNLIDKTITYRFYLSEEHLAKKDQTESTLPMTFSNKNSFLRIQWDYVSGKGTDITEIRYEPSRKIHFDGFKK